MSKWRLRLATIGLLALALVVLGAASGCGGDEEEAAEEKAAPEAPPKPASVRFQLSFFPNAQHVGFLVAANRGFYKDENLNVEVIPGGPTVEATLSLAQGNSDIAQVDFPQFLQAVEKGAPMTFIGLTYQQDPLVYVALKETKLGSPEDLKGLSYGQQQAGPLDAELQALLADAGLSAKDIKIVSIGFTIEDLLNGKSDVFPSRIFFHPAQFEEAGIDYPGGLNVLDPNEYGVAVASQGLAVNNDFLAENRDAVVRFLRASVRGWEATIEDQQAALADLKKFIPEGASTPLIDRLGTQNTIKIVTTSANGEPYEDILAIDKGYLERSQDILRKFNIVEKDIDLDEVIDTSLVEEASEE